MAKFIVLSVSTVLKATCSSTPDHPLGINAIQSLGDTFAWAWKYSVNNF